MKFEMPDWLSVYHHLPYPLRVIGAGARGYYLKWWRYGKQTEQLVTETLGREVWSAEQWKNWQEERLAFILHSAAIKVPYYRGQWEKRRRAGDTASWDYLENWPVLSKEAVRSDARRFVADDCDIRTMYHEHTSGTSGKSLDLWWSRETVQRWYALFEARCRLWHGVSRHDRWAILGGQLVTPVSQRHPPFWVWNAGLNQLYMSSYHLAPDLISAYLDALQRHRIVYLWGYTSSLYALAMEAIRQKRTDLQMKVVFTNAEPLHEYQRSAIEEAFNCPARETYGMAEIVAAASECQYGHMHIWPEVGHIEVMNADQAVAPGISGDLIFTGLFNTDMPLIRYQVGDEGNLSPHTNACPCGRSLPLLGKVHGRVDDVLYTSDGRQIGRLDPVFKAHLPVIEAQIIQEALNVIRVKVVPAAGFGAQDSQDIIQRIRQRLGSDVQVYVEQVAEIPRTKAGKFQAVVSLLKTSKNH